MFNFREIRGCRFSKSQYPQLSRAVTIILSLKIRIIRESLIIIKFRLSRVLLRVKARRLEMEIRRRYSHQMPLFQSHILADAFPPPTFSIPSPFFRDPSAGLRLSLVFAMTFSARAWLKHNLMWFKFAQKEREGATETSCRA